MDGFLLMNKPQGISSFDLVREVKRRLGERKVGHSGTLDPMAEGLMIIALGQGTKLLEYLIGLDKRYFVKAKFGMISDTFDAEGEIEEMNPSAVFEREEVEKIIAEKFLGKISQVPPKYSALKVGGKRACDIVRAGGEVSMQAREVQIDRFELVDYLWPTLSFEVDCGSGTYIRSLIHDLGQVLGCGAYVMELRRDRVGDWMLGDAVSLEDLREDDLICLEDFAKKFECLDLAKADLDALSDGRVLLGKKIEQGGVKMAFFEGKFLGVLESSSDQTGIKFKKMIV
ncbi:tRNA pseudouridine(55) synthase TruB [Patescibacteria group bacterium]|nr:tRNA pseudouridine(55) synthase TruB [Patescibacteria group bacterium]